MLWNSNNLMLGIDLTTRCNAGCPQCHRTDLNGLKADKRLPNVVWSLEQFKKAFSVEDCNQISTFDICGIYGDPMMVPDIAKIVKYIAESNPQAKIQINTNGSLRSEDVWWDCCVSGGKNLHWFISVEGTTQEMHQIYRQHTFLDKILNNMDIISQTQSVIHTQCLVWRHNENHLQEIEDLCRKHGSTSHRISVTTRNRNFKNGRIEFTNPRSNGQNFLERSTHKPGETVNGYVQVERRRYVKKDELVTDELREHKDIQKDIAVRQDGGISCEWGNKNALTMDYNGQIHPCCYFQNPYANLGLSTNEVGFEERFLSDPLMQEYKTHEKELNLFHNSMKNILNHIWYKQTLQNSWKTQPNEQCKTMCGGCS